jgi:hypothetical protein
MVRRRATGRSPRRQRRRRKAFWWSRLSLDELLDVRIRDLGLRVEASTLEPRVAQLQRELQRAGFRFRPYVWLSTDWFTPDGATGFAIPFFLGHPRLARLERHEMLQVEGGTREWCMRLLRHETAHALDHAYRLSRRRRWAETFGSPSEPYRVTYMPQPDSRRYVQNLNNWYAQSHPFEDFAETFAVWLRPRSAWHERYAGWMAMRKLRYVDDLMQEIRDQPPLQRTRERLDAVATLAMTLREYYQRKQARYGREDRSIYDRDLRRLFTDEPDRARRRLASSFLRARQRDLCRQVAALTGQHLFVVDEVLNQMTARCRDLRLRLAHSERETNLGAAVLLTVHTVRLTRIRHREYFR